jgi:hybrid cluster-associated redox disulfide protein
MIDLNTTVEEVLAHDQRLASLFVRHRMICVGCDIARFHTLREAAFMYGLEPEQFLADVQRILDEPTHITTSSHSTPQSPPAPNGNGGSISSDPRSSAN